MSEKMDGIVTVVAGGSAQKVGTGVAAAGATSVLWLDLLRSVSEVAALLLPVVSISFLLFQWWAAKRLDALKVAAAKKELEDAAN